MTRFYDGMPDAFARLNDMPTPHLVINGGFDVWQKATSYVVTTVLAFGGPDRWAAKQATTAQCTLSQAAPSPALAGSKNCLKLLLTGTSANAITLATAFETIDCVPYQGKDVCLSFKCLKGSTWNPASLAVQLFTGTGTDQSTSSLSSGTWTGSAAAINTTVSPTTAWVTYEVTGTIPSNATQIGIVLVATPTGAAVDANSYLMLTRVRIDPGNKTSDFDPPSWDQEYMRCRRHYRKSFPYATAVAQNSGVTAGALAYIVVTGGGTAFYSVREAFDTQMRASPTVTFYNPAAANAKWRNTNLGADSSTSAAATIALSENGFSAQNQQVAGDLASHTILVHYDADANL